MKNKELSSEQIEYHHDSDTWVPKGKSITGLINCEPIGPRGNPLMIIDGIKLSWDEFAQTVLTHEGFHFRIEFIDI